MIYNYLLIFCLCFSFYSQLHSSEHMARQEINSRLDQTVSVRESAFQAYQELLQAPDHLVPSMGKKALSHAQAALKEHPDQLDLEYLLGAIHMHRGNVAVAESHFQKVLESTNELLSLDGLEGLIDIELARKKVAKKLLNHASQISSEPVLQAEQIITNILKQTDAPTNTLRINTPRDIAFILHYASQHDTALRNALIERMNIDDQPLLNNAHALLVQWLADESPAELTAGQIDALITTAGKKPDSPSVRRVATVLSQQHRVSLNHIEWLAKHLPADAHDVWSLVQSDTIDAISSEQLCSSGAYQILRDTPAYRATFTTLTRKALEHASSQPSSVSSLMNDIESLSGSLDTASNVQLHLTAARYYQQRNNSAQAAHHYSQAMQHDASIAPTFFSFIQSKPKGLKGAHELERSIIERYQSLVAHQEPTLDRLCTLVEMITGRFGPDGSCGDQFNGQKALPLLEQCVNALEGITHHDTRTNELLCRARVILAGHYFSFSKKTVHLEKGLAYRNRIIESHPAALEQLADLLVKKQNYDEADATVKLLTHYLYQQSLQEPHDTALKSFKGRIAFKHALLLLKQGIQSDSVAGACQVAHRFLTHASSLVSSDTTTYHDPIDSLFGKDELSLLSTVAKTFYDTTSQEARYHMAPIVQRFARLTLDNPESLPAARQQALQACERLSELGNLDAALLMHRHNPLNRIHPTDYFSSALLRAKDYDQKSYAPYSSQAVEDTTRAIITWRDSLGYSSLELLCDLIIAHQHNLKELMNQVCSTDYIDTIGLITDKGFISDTLNEQQLMSAHSIIDTYINEASKRPDGLADKCVKTARVLQCAINCALLQTEVSSTIQSIGQQASDHAQLMDLFKKSTDRISTALEILANQTGTDRRIVRITAYFKLLESIFCQTFNIDVAGEKLDRLIAYCKQELARVDNNEAQEIIELGEFFKFNLKRKVTTPDRLPAIMKEIEKFVARSRSRTGVLFYIASNTVNKSSKAAFLEKAARMGNRTALREVEMVKQLRPAKKK